MSRSKSRKATSVLSFRLMPSEHETIRLAASARGLGPTTFARRATFAAAGLAAPRDERAPNPRAADLAKVLGQLGRIASSANQLAKVANATRAAASLTATLAIVDELTRVRAELVER
jgi:uncharacterized protein (DUF1778 family)